MNKRIQPGSKEWKDRVGELLTVEMAVPKCWFYGSFADDDGFRGGLFMQAHGITDFTIQAGLRGMNPGGQLYCVELPDDAPIPAEKYRNVLLSKEMLQEACGPIVKVKDGSEVR